MKKDKKMNKIKQLFSSAVILAALVLAPLALVGGITHAQVNYNPGGAACGGAEGTNVGTAGTCNAQKGDTLPQLVANIINIFSWIIGAVSVIMIIYGGFRYITSGGNDTGVKDAKNTILYAIIGLVIVALAQIIVNFVLNQSSTLVN